MINDVCDVSKRMGAKLVLKKGREKSYYFLKRDMII